MDISVILELIEPDVRNYNLSNRQMKTKTDDSGSFAKGHFSHVKADRDPHFVKKTSKDSTMTFDDGYWYFIKNVIDHRLWENPYFPRVYEFKKYEYNKEAHYRVKLETLMNYTSLRREELIAIMNRMVGKDSQEAGIVSDDSNEINIWYDIVSIFKSIWAKQIHTEGFDPKLLEAVNEMWKMNPRGSKYYYDLHAENVMIRRGPHGVHPVIVDPFSFKNIYM